MLLPHAALPLTQVTHVGSREDLKGNAVTLHYNDFGLNGNSVSNVKRGLIFMVKR